MFHMEPSTLRYYEDAGLLTNVGRTPAGQRIYLQCHINRMRTICCFKHAGMSIEDLKRFFAFEADEPEHIDDIVALLEDRRAAIEAQRRMSGASDVGVGRGFSGSMGASFVTKKPEEVFWRLSRLVIGAPW